MVRRAFSVKRSNMPSSPSARMPQPQVRTPIARSDFPGSAECLASGTLAELYRDIDFLAAAIDGYRYRVARTFAVQEDVSVELAGDFLAVDGYDHVAADVDAPHSRLRDAVTSPDAADRCGTAFCYGFDEKTLLHRQIECLRKVAAHWQRFHAEERAMHAAVGHQVVRDGFGGVDGDGEADTRCGAARCIDRGVDPDDFAVRIDQWAAGIAAINGRVGLDGFIDERGLAGLHGAA